MPFWCSSVFVVLMLLFICPLGLFLMWKYKKFSKTVRIFLTVVFSLYIVGLFMMFSADSEIVNRIGTSIMNLGR